MNAAVADRGPVGRKPLAARLVAAVAARESQVVLGVDPDPQRLWPAALRGGEGAGGRGASALRDGEGAAGRGAAPGERAARAVVEHCRLLIDAAGPACVAAKLQLACFERLGPSGWRALFDVADHVRAAGLLLIADGKRGDVDVSERAYAQALVGHTETPFGDVDGLGADLATVSPLLGRDSVEAFLAVAREAGAGLLVLVRTSNPGAADFQDLVVAGAPRPVGERPADDREAGGGPVWEWLARLVDDLGGAARGGLCDVGAVVGATAQGGLCDVGAVVGATAQGGLCDVGAVVGATAPGHLSRMRELMPRAVFLLPGIGAQGGRVDALAPAFAPGRAGGLVSASRAISDAHAASGGEPAAAARAVAEHLREQAWALSG